MMNISNDSSIEQNTMHNVLNIIMQISFPYIFIVSIIGICGNFLTIILLSKRSLSKNFNNCTLIALALTDLLFNLALVSRCINDLTKSNSDQLCRLLSFLSHLAELLSACFTAHFTAQRFIAVRFPLSVFIERKIHLIHYVVVSLCLIFGIIYCLALTKYNAYTDCHEELQLTWFISDALLSFLIPLIIITILNILIIFHLKKGFQNNQQYRFTKREQQLSSEMLPLNFRKKKSPYAIALNTHYQPKIYQNVTISHSRGLFSQKQTNGDPVLMNGRVHSMDLLNRPSSIQTKSQSYRVTRMLIVVSTCFLLLNAPSHICTIGFKIYTLKTTLVIDNTTVIPIYLYDNFKQLNQTLSTLSNNIELISISKVPSNENAISDNMDLKWMELFYIIIVITQHIAYASYSINFFLYSFCGMKFRHELMRCMSKKRRKMVSRSTTAQNML